MCLNIASGLRKGKTKAVNTVQTDLVIVGAGPAGLAAAIAAKKAGIKSLIVLEREDQAGGILNQCIHNGFGLHRFKVELTGPEYANRDVITARDLGIDIRLGVTVLSLSKDKVITAISKQDGYVRYQAKAVVLAMGCRERPRGALAIPGTRCAGVYSAGTAQKFVNMEGYMPGKRVVILGSGDIGLIMARRMTLQGAKVLACVELMPYSSGLNRNIVQCLDDYDIPLYLSHTVVDIQGRERLESVTIVKVDENRLPIPGSEFQIECDTLLLSVGLIPENELSIGADVMLSPATSGAVVKENFETNIPGVFACGNVLHVHDLVDFVSEESFIAGEAAAAYIQGKESKADRVQVLDGHGVRGVVPQRLNVQALEEKSVRFMFRPDRVYRGATVEIRQGDKVVVSKKHMILTPGEMVVAELSQKHLENLATNENITVQIVPAE